MKQILMREIDAPVFRPAIVTTSSPDLGLFGNALTILTPFHPLERAEPDSPALELCAPRLGSRAIEFRVVTRVSVQDRVAPPAGSK